MRVINAYEVERSAEELKNLHAEGRNVCFNHSGQGFPTSVVSSINFFRAPGSSNPGAVPKPMDLGDTLPSINSFLWKRSSASECTIHNYHEFGYLNVSRLRSEAFHVIESADEAHVGVNRPSGLKQKRKWISNKRYSIAILYTSATVRYIFRFHLL